MSFPRLALGIGLVIALVLIATGATNRTGELALPLLTLLILCEFGFIVTAIGAFIALRQITAQGFDPRAGTFGLGCAILAVAFLVLGILWWPGGASG